MKKTILLLLALFVIGSAAIADIQAPPASRQTPIRKLGRGVANILYGFTEVPASVVRATDVGGSSTFVPGMITGGARTIGRFGWGVYEVATFPFPTYKGHFSGPSEWSINFDTQNGYEEYPPEIEFLSASRYCRVTRY